MAKRKGKYDDVIGTLPATPCDDLERQQRIDIEKAELSASHNTLQIASRYVEMRRMRDSLKAQEEALQLLIDACGQLLTESQENNAPEWGQYGVEDNALRLPSGDTIRIQKEPSPRVVNKEEFRQWCIANGYERELVMHSSKMASICKERLITGDAAPDGTEVTSYTKVVFTEA